MEKRRFNSAGAWCAQASGYVIHPDDRKVVRQELEGHFEDRIEELKATGLDYQSALRLAEDAMGDADEVGRLLRRIHTPYLSWAVTLSKYICIATLLLFLFKAHLSARLFEYLRTVGLNHTPETTIEETYDRLVEIYLHDPIPLKTGEWFEKNGYTFTVEEAAYGRYTDPFMPQKYFIVRIGWKKPYPWSMDPALLYGLTIRDDQGNEYGPRDGNLTEDGVAFNIPVLIRNGRDPNRLALTYAFGSVRETYWLEGGAVQ